jgi:hypothetical protein
VSKFIDKFEKHKAEIPPFPEFAYVVMSEGDTTHHIFLLDMITENYKLIRTMKKVSRKDALAHAKNLATTSASELIGNAQSLGRFVDEEILKYDEKLNKKEK